MFKKTSPGDKVAIVAPSASLSNIFPAVFRQGLERVKTVFGLDPILMHHLGALQSGTLSMDQKRDDLHEAFSRDDISAVIAVIGGNDQIGLIPCLDPEVFRKNPKAFFGYSDNTHLHHFLWNLRIPSFYGASLMTQFAMQGRMYASTKAAITWAFTRAFDEWMELKPAANYTDIDLPWDNPENLSCLRKEEPSEGMIFSDPGAETEGILWGGCLESIAEMLKIGRIPNFSEMLNKDQNLILFLETSEHIPTPTFVQEFFEALGKAKVLERISGLLMGRPKAWSFTRQMSYAEKVEYRQSQREVVLSSVRKFQKHAIIVQNIDFGHTDPQYVIPSFGRTRIESGKVFVRAGNPLSLLPRQPLC